MIPRRDRPPRTSYHTRIVVTIDIIGETEHQEADFNNSTVETMEVVLAGLEAMGRVNDWRIDHPEEW